MRVKKKTDKNKKNILGFIIFSLCTISILCVFYILFFISEKEGCLNKTVSNSRSQKYNLFQSQRYTFLPFTDSLNEYYSEMVNEKVRRYSSKLSDEIKNRVCESRQKKERELLAPWRECDLSRDEWPDYFYFTNSSEWHYHILLENMVAMSVKEFASKSGMENEKWRLKRIFKKGDYCYAFVESENRNELYILMKENSTSTAMVSYIIGADIRKSTEGEISFNYSYSYNSDLKWQPYDMNKEYSVNAYVHQIDYVFDSIYGVGGHYALLAYLELIGMNEETHWSIDENWLYVGTNGNIAYITFFSDDYQVDLLIDVWNDEFAVLKGIDS